MSKKNIWFSAFEKAFRTTFDSTQDLQSQVPSGSFAACGSMWMLYGLYDHVDLLGGGATPLKNMKVSWDDDIPNIWKVIKLMFQTTSQGFMVVS